MWIIVLAEVCHQAARSPIVMDSPVPTIRSIDRGIGFSWNRDVNLMQVNSQRWAVTSIWLAVTGLVLLFEVQMACHRARSTTFAGSTATHLSRARDPVIEQTNCSRDCVCLGEADQAHTSAILVVGSTGSVLDGEFEITLRLEPINQLSPRRGIASAETKPTIGCPVPTRIIASNNKRNWEPSAQIKPIQTTPSESQKLDVSRRVFYIHSPRRPFDDVASYSAIECRLIGEAASIRVYAEQSNLNDDCLRTLTHELVRLADNEIGPAVHALVGSVRDIDGDGKLAVVLTDRLGQNATTFAEVDGLTRASDFSQQAPRPFGNEADVVFLNSRLRPGEHLCAVLAHEWAHAAIFGRRYGTMGPDSKQPLSEDDWLNEALAHVIEVQASGVSTNVAHRIQSFLERPETAPLLIRNYYGNEYWRHHGCRGAGFLFVEWCMEKSGPQLLAKLIDGKDAGIEKLERVTDRSFNELFREWTTSIGVDLARSLDGGVRDDANPTCCRNQILCHRPPRSNPMFSEWKWNDAEAGTMTLNLKGTTAAFVRLVLEQPAANWHLLIEAPSACGLQMTVIPINTAKDDLTRR